MAQAGVLQGLGYASIGMSRATEAYGAWYEGERAKDYYRKMQSMTDERQQVQKKLLQVGFAKQDAADAQKDAEYSRQLGDVKEKHFKDDTDKQLATHFANMAQGGIDMSYGSPMEYMDAAINERAEGLGIMQWQNDHQTWKMESEAKALKDKATIMLHDVYIEESAINYQQKIYKLAEQEADEAAKWKQFQAYVGAFSDSFGGKTGSSGSFGQAQSGDKQHSAEGMARQDSYTMGGKEFDEDQFYVDYYNTYSTSNFSGGQ